MLDPLWRWTCWCLYTLLRQGDVVVGQRAIAVIMLGYALACLPDMDHRFVPFVEGVLWGEGLMSLSTPRYQLC